MSRIDTKIIIGLLVLGVFTHLLWLGWPNQVVFDEVHFGKFVTAYCCTGERFFDIHPPHAKLLIAGVGWLGGYRGDFSFDHIGQPYVNVPVSALRLVPALMGVLLPLVVYWLMRSLGGFVTTSALGALLVAFDNAMVVQTRIIALDGVLLVATFGSLAAFLTADWYKGPRQWLLYIAAGALAGLAVGTKFTGLAALALLGLLVMIYLIKERSLLGIKKWVSRGLVVLVSAVVVYLAGWVFHFVLLTLPGSGDAFHKPDFSQGSLAVSFWEETVELHRIMLSANYGLKATHPYASNWWEWPLMQRSVFYWQGSISGGDGNKAAPFIYFLGNPFVWWGATLLGVTVIITSVVMYGQGVMIQKNKQLKRAALWIPLLGFAIAMLPMVRIPRALFLYHYLTPLLFVILFGLLWLQNIGIFSERPGKKERYVYAGIVGVAFVLFIVFSPLTYGIPVSEGWRDGLFWLKTWR